MYREILNDLANWKESKDDKRSNVLVLHGARLVGKSFVARDFAEGFYDNFIEISMSDNEMVKYLNEGKLDEWSFVKTASFNTETNIVPGKTLIIFDNIDALNNANEVVQFFVDKLSDYDILITTSKIVSSWLSSDNINKVDFFEVTPISFYEFLIVNKQVALCDVIKNYKDTPIEGDNLAALLEYLKLYYYVGGMPSVVKCYVDDKNLDAVLEAKRAVYKEYIESIGQILPTTLMDKCDRVFRSMGAQLIKENKKFQYGVVKLTARAREYGEGVDWLYNNGFVGKVNRVTEGVAPLKNKVDVRSFELFMTDIGMLSLVYDLDYNKIVEMFETNDEYMQALTEQFVYQELMFNNNVGDIYYWVSEATAKVNFLFEDSGVVLPVEINLNVNTKAQSIKVYILKYNPQVVLSITKDRLTTDNCFLRLPLYAIWNI